MSLGVDSRSRTSDTSENQAAPAVKVPPAARTWLSCAGLFESEMPLATLPEGMTFGDDFPEPVRHERGLLRYRGRMSHASFVHLQGLSRDRQYQRALEQLFVATSMSAVKVQPLQRGWLIAPVAAIVLAGVGLGGSALFYSKTRTPIQTGNAAAPMTANDTASNVALPTVSPAVSHSVGGQQ